MGAISDSINTFNTTVRTLLAVVLVGLATFASWFGYNFFRGHELELAARDNEIKAKSAEIAQLAADLQASQARIDQLDTALRLMRVDHRVAHLTVLDQATDPDSDDTLTRVQFQEVNDSGDPIDEPRNFTLKGDVVYIDYWVVKFDDRYVQEAELDRGTSICLFRRIYGEAQNPRDGFTIDQAGARPNAYGRGSTMSDFERKIWDDFWNLANDPDRAAEMGVRAAHGEAPFTKVRRGKRYTLQLRASGGLTITPGEDVVLPNQPAT